MVKKHIFPLSFISTEERDCIAYTVTNGTVYYCCFGSNVEILSLCFQPLTEFKSKKCKRCGFYEEDSIKSDDVFEEWELCPSDFTAPDGEYVRYNKKEFNATFLCLECTAYSNG